MPPINTLEYAKIFQTQLDKQVVQKATSGWMEANAGQVKYNGGDEIKIPELVVQGLADYDRDEGFNQGSVTYKYQTHKLTQDRGRTFQLDSQDVDETNFGATAASVLSEFQRTKVIPEIDAYRYSFLAAKAAEIGMFAASRLVRTETTFMANMAEMASYEEAEIDRYQFIATLDMRTSPQCREMDMKVFKVSEAVPGKNMPPLHPFCRSTTVAYFGDEELENIKRRARDPVTGRTYLVPANMNYEQWYNNIKKKYGPEHIEVLEKKIRNKSADKKQFKRYREILGDRIPKSFDDFQDLKYNRKQEWEKLQDNLYVKSRLKDGRFGSTINPEKQAPHLESTRVEGKSYFFDGVDVQALFDKYAGTGVVERTNSGKRSNKEIVLLDKNENIGIVVSLKGVKRANAIKIHHSKKRTHIVPHFEEE